MAGESKSVLIVDSDEDFGNALARELILHAYEVRAVVSPNDALRALSLSPAAVLLADLDIAGKESGELLREARRISPGLQPVLMAAASSADDWQDAQDLGAVALLEKPFTARELLHALELAVESKDGFHGTIHGLSLPDILQVFHLGQRSVVIHVGGEVNGTIHMERGEVVHARCGILEGVPAFRKLFAVRSGSIRTDALSKFVRTIDSDFISLVLDTAREFDEHSAQVKASSPLPPFPDFAATTSPMLVPPEIPGSSPGHVPDWAKRPNTSAATTLESYAYGLPLPAVDPGPLESSPGSASSPSSKPTDAPPPPPPMSRMELSPPAFPSADMPTDVVWPASTAKNVLMLLAGAEPIRHDQLTAGTTSQSDQHERLTVWEMGPCCVKTSERRVFATLDQARAAMLALAQRKMMLGKLLAPGTVLALTRDDDGFYWLWTIAPWLTTLEHLAAQAAETGDDELLGAQLERFATAAADAMVLAVRHRIVLHLHPSNFATDGEHVWYVADHVDSGTQLSSAGRTMLGLAEAYAGFPKAVEHYLRAIEKQVTTRLTKKDIVQLGIQRDMAREARRSPTVADALARMGSEFYSAVLIETS